MRERCGDKFVGQISATPESAPPYFDVQFARECAESACEITIACQKHDQYFAPDLLTRVSLPPIHHSGSTLFTFPRRIWHTTPYLLETYEVSARLHSSNSVRRVQRRE